jgi:hypothetical protein
MAVALSVADSLTGGQRTGMDYITGFLRTDISIFVGAITGFRPGPSLQYLT